MLRLYFGQILSVKKEMQFEFELMFSRTDIMGVLIRYEEILKKKRSFVKRDIYQRQFKKKSIKEIFRELRGLEAEKNTIDE